MNRIERIYNEEYNKINNLYINSNKSIPEACKEINITVQKYYRICKKINRLSIAKTNDESKKITKKTVNNSKKKKEKTNDESKKVRLNKKKVKIERVKKSTKKAEENVNIEEYGGLYDKIEKLYKEDELSLEKSCKKADITLGKYYKICKALNKKSIADGNKIQKGGFIKKDKKKENDDISSEEYKKFIDEHYEKYEKKIKI